MADREKTEIRVGVIGCGVIAANHLAALRETAGVTVAALCDIRPERAEERRAEFCPSARVYTDFREMLEKEGLDAVHVLTPHYLHFEMASEVLRRDLHLCLEKPACLGKKEAEALLRIAEKSRGCVTVCFQNRMNAAMREMKRRIALYGGPRGGRAMVSWCRDAAYYGDDWHGKKATEGGGVLINQAIHTLDLLLWYCGRPTAVTAAVANRHLRGVIDVEDSADLLLRFENGTHGHFSATTAYETDAPNFVEVLTEGHRLVLYGNRLYDNDDAVLLDGSAAAYVGKCCYGDGHMTLIRAFYEAILTGGEPPVSLESAMTSVLVLDACYRSENEEIKIDVM